MEAERGEVDRREIDPPPQKHVHTLSVLSDCVITGQTGLTLNYFYIKHEQKDKVTVRLSKLRPKRSSDDTCKEIKTKRHDVSVSKQLQHFRFGRLYFSIELLDVHEGICGAPADCDSEAHRWPL